MVSLLDLAEITEVGIAVTKGERGRNRGKIGRDGEVTITRL